MTDVAGIEVEDLLKIVLVLVVVWFALEILETFLSITLGLFEVFKPVIALLVLVLIVLWLVDRL